jgi:hypothetical protein
MADFSWFAIYGCCLFLLPVISVAFLAHGMDEFIKKSREMQTRNLFLVLVPPNVFFSLGFIGIVIFVLLFVFGVVTL